MPNVGGRRSIKRKTLGGMTHSILLHRTSVLRAAIGKKHLLKHREEITAASSFRSNISLLRKINLSFTTYNKHRSNWPSYIWKRTHTSKCRGKDPARPGKTSLENSKCNKRGALTEHRVFNSYVLRFKNDITDKCCYCGAKETTPHAIARCVILKNRGTKLYWEVNKEPKPRNLVETVTE